MRTLPSELAARATLCLLALVGCGGPPPDPPELAQIELTPIASMLGDHVLVLGLPGSTEPRVGVAGVDLDAPLPIASGTVAADGSFLLEVPGSEGHRLRITTEREGQRSSPLDLIAALGRAEPAPIALPCLRVPSLIELAAPLVISNDCEETVVVGSITLRAPAALEVGTIAPLSIAPGEAATVELERTGSDPIDEALLVTISAPAPDRRAVTIVGR